MDKTISISLGGYSFIVDEAAYLKLRKYLDDVRRSLKGMEGTDDVISDVEIRIAELLKQKTGSREVVNETDVDGVIEIMGKPEQYLDEDGDETPSSKSSFGSSNANFTTKKKLYRDLDDKVLGGVLSGIAHYFGIESWITRVLWILMFFADIPLTGTSFSILAYIILWIILPKAETATQKYEMMGEPGNIASIKKNALSGTLESVGRKSEFSEVFTGFLKIIGKIILIGIGLILILIGLSLAFGAIFTLVITGADFPVQFFGHFFDFPWQDTLSKVLLLILLGVPGLLFILFGARLISRRVKISRIVIFVSLGVWVLAMLGASVMAASVLKGFAREVEFVEKKAYTLDKDTVTISFNDFNVEGERQIKWDLRGDLSEFEEINGKFVRKIDRDIEVRQSPTDRFYVDVVYSSKGSSMENARNQAEKIIYSYAMNSNSELVFNNYIELPKNSKFRDQDVSLVIYVPAGKVIHSQNVENLIFMDDQSDSKNYQRGTNKFYKFVDQHYECLNCTGDDERTDADEDSDSARIKISNEGIKIQDGNKKVEIKTNKIKISDGTDTINIGGTGN